MAVRQLTCPTCGAQFLGHHLRVYCSRKCQPCEIAKVRKRVQSYTYDCAVCGRTYSPTKKEHSTTCSRECGAEWTGLKAAAKANGLRVVASIARAPCKGCGRMFGKAGREAYCSADCRKEAQRVSTLPDAATCKGCGATYQPHSSGGMPSRYCGEECRASAYRAHARSAKIRRKARLRGAVTVERVDPLRVFARDGWRCCECGRSTPSRLRGSTDARAPELDHIVPLAGGGEHSYRNTRCLCRACNGRKADGPGGQLLLFG